MFDPYQQWLGIPKEQQPPTYYQILDIDPTEEDRKIIEEASLNRTATVRANQNGPHSKECTRLLNEIALARAILLNPEKRRIYDAALRDVHEQSTQTPAGFEWSSLDCADTDDPSSSTTHRRSVFMPSQIDPLGWLYMGLVLISGLLSFLVTRLNQ